MLHEILLPLTSFFSGFNIFRYITFRASYAAMTALLFSLLLGPLFIRFFQKKNILQQVRQDEVAHHSAKRGTPTMGGIIIVFSITASSLLWMNFSSIYSWIALLATIGFGIVGFIDDMIKHSQQSSGGLHARFKLIGQILISSVVVWGISLYQERYVDVVFIPFFKHFTINLGALYVPFGVFLLVSISNAVNLTDGLDGLAIGLVLMIALAFSVLAYITGRADFSQYLNIPFIAETGELAVIALALAGSCVGFLWYNSYPAAIMMGDTGSMALGGLLGTLAILIKKEVLLVIIGGIFVIEVLSVIIQVLVYKITRKRVFRMAPLHHHYELKGWSETQVVQRFWILGGLLAIIGLSTLKMQ